MGFKAVWGFDPDEAIKAQQEFQRTLNGAKRTSEVKFEELADVPSSADAQILELRWLFRL